MTSAAIFEQSLRQIKLDLEAQAGLPPLPARIIQPPVGLDAAGNLIKPSCGVAEELKSATARSLHKELSLSLTPEKRAARANLTLPDQGCQVSSCEFSLFTSDYAAEIAGGE